MDENEKVEQDMSKVAESLENFSKSTEPGEDDVMDEILKAIREMGPEELKKRVKTLSKAQQELLNGILEKGSSMDKEMRMDTDHGQPGKPQSAREPETDTVSNSKEGVDEWDEKFMKESNAQQRHQGGDGQQGSDEWQGQVIKSEEEQICEAALQKGEWTEEDLEKGCNYMSKMIKRMKERGMDRDRCMDALSKKGYDKDLALKAWDNKDEAEAAGKKVDLDKKGPKVKGQEKKPMAKSEEVEASQEEKIEKSEGLDDALADAEAEKQEAKEEQPAQEPVKKSIPWGNPQVKLLGASTRRGQNCHYSVSDTIVAQNKQYEEFKKSNDVYFGEAKKAETLEKSEDPNKKLSINEMIEKGVDMNQARYTQAVRNMKKRDQGGFLVKSFDEEQIAKDMGIDPKEAAKILGDDSKKKVLNKGGEGSRGGKVVGRTRSGKPIYESHGHSGHKDFDYNDHMDAAAHHADAHRKLKAEYMDMPKEDRIFYPAKKKEQAEHHREQNSKHVEAMSGTEEGKRIATEAENKRKTARDILRDKNKKVKQDIENQVPKDFDLFAKG